MGFLTPGVLLLLGGSVGTGLPPSGVGAVLAALAWFAVAVGAILVVAHVAVGPYRPVGERGERGA